MTSERPVIDYSAKDYAGFRRLMLDAKREKMPDWTSESPNDFGVTLLELFAYIGDILSFYQDRIATEAFLSTAINRTSVVDIARMLDYRARGTVAATVDVEITTNGAVTIPAKTRITTSSIGAVQSGEPPVIFEVNDDTEFTVAETLSVPCTEGVTVTEEVGISDGRLYQTFDLDRFPVVDRSVRVFVNEGIGDVEWGHVDRLIEATSTQEAFATQEDSRGVITIFFGDGVNGRAPAQGATITVEYRVGVGERGNVGPGTLVEIQSDDTGVQDAVVSLVNPIAASGGDDQESTESVRRNAPQRLRALRRAVSLEDYARVAQEVPGIVKSWATQVAYQTVAVYVSGLGAGSPASTDLKAQVAEYLEDRKMSNITVLVEDPVFVPVDIGIDLSVKPEFVQAQVKDRVEVAVNEILAYEHVNFAYFLPVSAVYSAIDEVDGVRYANVDVLDRDSGVGKDNIQFADNEIPIVGEITISASGGILGS